LNLDLYTLYMLSMVILSIAMVVYMVFATLGSRGKREPEKKVVTVLRCPRCGYTKTRDFREGDYVGKVVDEVCPKCGISLVVDAIYEESITSLNQVLRNKRKQEGARKTSSQLKGLTRICCALRR